MIEEKRESLQLTLARSEYISGQYKLAEKDFVLIDKNSNEFTYSLLGLAVVAALCRRLHGCYWCRSIKPGDLDRADFLSGTPHGCRHGP